MASPIRVECKHENCVFVVKQPGSKDLYCKHDDKKHHLTEETCPLYRPDWTKSTDQIEALRKRFGIAKK